MVDITKQEINEINDDGKLYQRWINKRVNAKKEGLECELTYEEYCYLVKQAGLKSSQLGFKGEKYVLARYDDSGNYSIGNCRFITQYENLKEQKTTDKMLLARQNNAKIMNEYMKTLDRNELSIRIKNGKEKSIKQQRINEINMQKRKEKMAKMNKAYMGIHNSQFGTFWITNGVDNMKWKDSKGNIPEGFYKGRVV